MDIFGVIDGKKFKQEIFRISMKMCFRKIQKYHIPG